MRKIDLSDYAVEGNTFQVRPSLVSVLFNQPKLDPREILRRDELARSIEECANESILIEEADYKKIIEGVNATDMSPFGRAVVPFLQRVLDAPKIEVREQ